MPAPYEFTVEVTDAETETEARDQAWASATQHVGTDGYIQVADMRLVSDGYRLIGGAWTRFFAFTIRAS